MDAMNSFQQTVAAIREMGGERTRSFHLSPCACGAPVWQQPCPICGYYPMGNDPAERERAQNSGVTKERWMRFVERHGSIAAWYFENFKKVVAWKSDDNFREEILALIREANSKAWPDPSVVYDEAIEHHRTRLLARLREGIERKVRVLQREKKSGYEATFAREIVKDASQVIELEPSLRDKLLPAMELAQRVLQD